MNSMAEGIMALDYDLKVIQVNDILLDIFQMNEKIFTIWTLIKYLRA